MAYTINQGDTLSKIAAANKTTVQDIMKANPNITDPNKIQAGGSLNLPSLAQSNGVRANFPSTPAPTNTTIAPSQQFTQQTSTPAMTKPAVSFSANQPTWQTELQNVQAAKGTSSPANIPFTWSGLGTAMTGKQPTQTTLTGGQRAGGISTTNLPSYGTPQATGGSTTGAMAQTAPSTTTTGTQGSQANTEASSAGSKVGNTFVMQNGTVIDATTGKVISGPTSSQAQTLTPASIPDGKTTPTGQTGYTDTRDLSYGGLIQELLQKQAQSAAEVNRMKNELTGQLGQVQNRAIPLEFKTGREQTLQNIAGQRIANEQANLQNLGNIYGTAIGAVKPIAGSAYALDPVTGKIVGGGAGIGQAGNVVGNLAIAQKLPEMQANLSVAQQSQDTIQNLLKSVPELNSSSFSDLNGLLQFVGSKVSDPNYQTLANTISQFVNSIAQATGQSPDAILLNTKTQGQNMGTVIANLMAQANNRYAALSNQAAGTSLPVNTAPTIGQSLVSGRTAGSTPSGQTNFNW